MACLAHAYGCSGHAQSPPRRWNADGGGNGELPRQVQPMKRSGGPSCVTQIPQEKSNSPRYCSRICGMIWMNVYTSTVSLHTPSAAPNSPAFVALRGRANRFRVVSNRTGRCPLRSGSASPPRRGDAIRTEQRICRKDTLSRVFLGLFAALRHGAYVHVRRAMMARRPCTE